MKLFTLYIALPPFPLPFANGTAEDYALRRIANAFGGFTSQRTKGGWMNPSTRTVEVEDALRVEIMAANPSVVSAFAETLGRDLGQKEVMVVAHNATVSFITVRELTPVGSLHADPTVHATLPAASGL
jgi:hypothetical protein